MTEFAGVDIVDLEPAAWRLAHLVDSIPDECDQSSLEAVHSFLGSFSVAEPNVQLDGPFGPTP
ncbi:MAG: hypothetical protein WB765_11550 [Acidimicrobiales bacterium]|jgi:hypothetical protein